MKALYIGTLCVLLFVLFTPTDAQRAPTTGMLSPLSRTTERTVLRTKENGPSISAQAALFPHLTNARISALSVHTPQRSFEFQCNAQGDVIVNGHQADEEIFSTLMAQISQMPVYESPSFTPDDAPLMTLVVSTRDGKKHSARFYGSDGTQAHIFSSSLDAPAYHLTDAWRIGTLMMTCEGTRIQDETGKETPAVNP